MDENKRFKLGYVCGDFGLIDNDVWIDLHSMSENDEKNVQICINKMNALAEENEQLKIRFKEERERALKFGRDIDTLTVKNEQLKQFQDRVFSWIDMHLQRLPTLRDDEFESDNEFADPSLYSGAIQILETMKREFKGD